MRKKIEGYNRYEVDDQGNIWSLNYNNTNKEMKLKPWERKGYLQVKLFKGGKSKIFSVHRIVATAFIPNPLNKADCNHINEIKTDNRASNLNWMTSKENQNHGSRNKRLSISMTGSKNHKFKPKKYYSTKPTLRGNFKKICNNKSWDF